MASVNDCFCLYTKETFMKLAKCISDAIGNWQNSQGKYLDFK